MGVRKKMGGIILNTSYNKLFKKIFLENQNLLLYIQQHQSNLLLAQSSILPVLAGNFQNPFTLYHFLKKCNQTACLLWQLFFLIFTLNKTMITLLSSTLSPILLRSSLQWGGKYFSQWVWSANSLISSSFRPRDLMICHWYFIPPVFACSLLCKDQSQICITE